MLAQKVQELGLVAKEAILNPKDDTVCETSEPTESEITEHTDDTNTMKSPNVPECINTQEINDTVKDLNSQVSSLKSPVEPSQHHAKPNQHYGEWKQHHASPTITPQPSNKESLLENTIFQEKIQPSKKTSKLVPPQTQNRIEIVTRTDHQGVKEWLLPTNICQTRIHGKTLASNVCTIIATLCCRSFLNEKLLIPSDGELEKIINKFKQIILTGNILHSGLCLPSNQPNLEVRDVLNKVSDLKVTMVKDLGFFNAEDIKETLCQLLQGKGRQAGVLIFPPDRAVALLADNKQIAVVDSHEHGIHGGLMAVCEDTEEFYGYLQTKGPLNGCNFSQLAVHQ